MDFFEFSSSSWKSNFLIAWGRRATLSDRFEPIKNEKKILHFSEEKLQKELISIKGIGKWTVEMFLMFELGKPNIFSKGDIALINSVKKNYKMDDLKNSELDSLIKSWSPYNSTASLLLWKSIEEKVFFN